MFLHTTHHEPDYSLPEYDYFTGYSSLYEPDESLAKKCVTGLDRCELLNKLLVQQLQSLKKNQDGKATKVTKYQLAMDNNENLDLNQKLISYYKQSIILIDLAMENLKEYSELIIRVQDLYTKAQNDLKQEIQTENPKKLCDLGNDLLTTVTKYFFLITQLFFVANNFLSYYAANLLLNSQVAEKDPTLINDYEKLSNTYKETTQELKLCIKYYIEGNIKQAIKQNNKIFEIFQTLQAQKRIIQTRFNNLMLTDLR